MEHRWSDRRDLRLTVDIMSAGNKLMSCSSQNIGLGGTRLQLGSDNIGHALKIEQDVELIFYVPQANRETKYSINSKVVWQSESDIGLKFQDYNTSVFRSLQELINYKAN